jgi:hypothetical protein
MRLRPACRPVCGPVRGCVEAASTAGSESSKIGFNTRVTRMRSRCEGLARAGVSTAIAHARERGSSHRAGGRCCCRHLFDTCSRRVGSETWAEANVHKIEAADEGSETTFGGERARSICCRR